MLLLTRIDMTLHILIDLNQDGQKRSLHAQGPSFRSFPPNRFIDVVFRKKG